MIIFSAYVVTANVVKDGFTREGLYFEEVGQQSPLSKISAVHIRFLLTIFFLFCFVLKSQYLDERV